MSNPESLKALEIKSKLDAPFQFSFDEQKAIATHLRKSILEICTNAGSGHIGGSSSSVELLTNLYFGGNLRYDPNNLKHPNRDIVALRGHLGPLRYSIFSLLGEIEPQELKTYRRLGSRLQGHEEHGMMPGVDLSPSGSLGMLLSYGVGSVITGRSKGLDRLNYIFLGDGEEQEGNVSEAARHAAVIKADNLIAIMDKNGKQLSDPVSKVDSADIEQTWRGYGWDVYEPIDGHNFDEISKAYKWARETFNGKPKLIIANTIKGKCVEGAQDHFNGYHTVDVTPADKVSEAKDKLDIIAEKQSGSMKKVMGSIGLKLNSQPIACDVEKAFQKIKIDIQPTPDTSTSLNYAQGEYFTKLYEFMKSHPEICEHTYFLTADVTLRKMVENLGIDKWVASYHNVGIREQHMIAMSHGISLTDLESRTIINFLDAFTYRSADQLNALTQGGGNVILINDAAGITNARNGRSHQTSGQPGALYSMPGVTMIEPGDVVDMFNCFNWAIGESRGPVVIRNHRAAVSPFEIDPSERNLNNYTVYKTDNPELVIVATGMTVGPSIEVAKRFEKEGYPVRVINVLTPNKLNTDFYEQIADGKPLLCVYNGNPTILRDQIAGALFENSKVRPSRLRSHGFVSGTSGTMDELMKHYQLDADGIYQIAVNMLAGKDKGEIK